MVRKTPDDGGASPAATWRPRIVRKMQDDLERLTGQRPEVTRVAEHLWRLSLANSRVQLTVDYRADTVPGPGKWVASTLTVDGQSHVLANDEQHFARIFRDPDMYAHSPRLFPMPPARDVAEAPASIRHSYTASREKLPPGWGLSLGYDASRHRWVMGLTPPGGEQEQEGLRWFFAPVPHGWALDVYRPLQVVRDGEDLSEQAEGDVTAALALLVDGAVKAPPPAGGPPVSAARSAPSTPNSVQVRRTTVIRT